MFHRLNEFTIEVPLLSECRDDILPLAAFFLERFIKEYRLPAKSFDRSAVDSMQQYHWPGNIRELKNAVRRSLLISSDDKITAEHLNLNTRLDSADLLILTNEEKERKLLLEMLEKTGNNRTKTAKMLDMSRTALYEKLRKYGII